MRKNVFANTRPALLCELALCLLLPYEVEVCQRPLHSLRPRPMLA
jgi:hypothetical protein